eukprot:SAG25_NODE_291_length_10320_cov_2.259219_1_plen_180_part_00
MRGLCGAARRGRARALRGAARAAVARLPRRTDQGPVPGAAHRRGGRAADHGAGLRVRGAFALRDRRPLPQEHPRLPSQHGAPGPTDTPRSTGASTPRPTDTPRSTDRRQQPATRARLDAFFAPHNARYRRHLQWPRCSRGPIWLAHVDIYVRASLSQPRVRSRLASLLGRDELRWDASN